MSKIVGYVFGGPKDNCRVLEYQVEEARSISGVSRFSKSLQGDYPGKTIVIVDARPDVKDAYINAKKDGHFSAWLGFYDYLTNDLDALII